MLKRLTSPFTTGTPTIRYAWDSSLPTVVSGSSLKVSLPREGTHRLVVNATNGAKTTMSSVVTVNIDRTPPVTTEQLAGGMFSLTATDSGSGVAQTYYSLDGGPQTTYTGFVSVTNVVHTLQYWSVDNAGNVERTHTVKLPIEAPSITAISPGYVYNGAVATTITVTGADFSPTSVVLWNGTPLATTYVGTTQLTAVIPASDLTFPSVDKITVKTPGPLGGTSAVTTFSVYQQPDN